MSVQLHRQAEQLMADAQILEATGQVEKAAQQRLLAAQAEAQAFELIPVERGKTRGIIAVSAVALYRRAGALDDAIRAAHGYLATGHLPDVWRAELESLLDATRHERQARLAGSTLGAEGLEISLRGGKVGSGLAPLDLIVRKLQQVDRYTLRVGEWLANAPFRTRGPVAPEVAQMINPLVGVPTSGSYRFQLRLEMPEQLRLPLFEEERPLTPDVLVNALFEITESIVQGEENNLENHVGDADYRGAFLKLVRNIVPDGNDVGEIAFERTGGRSRASTVLSTSTRSSIERMLAPVQSQQVPADASLVGSLSGVLRALDLDKGVIELNEGGIERRQRCKAAKGAILDDVVTPLVNRPVVVVGHWTPNKRDFIIQDIYEDIHATDAQPSPDGSVPPN